MGENILEAEHTCVIVCAGDFALTDIPLSPGEGDMCIAADGGYRYCRQLGIEPDLVIGDMDSLGEQLRSELEHRKEDAPEKVRILSPEKDDTDTLAAIKEGLAAGYRRFCLYGALGGRLEHTIANIQCLAYLENHGAKGFIMNDGVMITVIKNETICFPETMEGYLSLFSLWEKAEGVTIRGMKYLLEDAQVSHDFPIGISNEFIGERGEVTVKNGMLLLIAAAYRQGIRFVR